MQHNLDIISRQIRTWLLGMQAGKINEKCAGSTKHTSNVVQQI